MDSSNRSSSLVITGASQVVCISRQNDQNKRGTELRQIHLIQTGAVVISDGIIQWVGPTSDLPPIPADAEVINANGKVVLPGFIDSHTHLVFAGARQDEFEQRLQGKTYEAIAAGGGGINATVQQVRRASKEELKAATRRRLQRLLSFGATTVEIKSGYGLNLADELKCLHVIAALNQEGPWAVVPTFLGAHAVPPELRNDRGHYVRLLRDGRLPEL